ncbi:beta-1:4-glucuronyltransferase 1-like protein [Dinothrombium tinctorium]|uniref:Beta-1,4-glucuronyltransferase 1 n=1 Tax=Dinothrombium tinctorium TaxID=1965070 RepID=A0A3S3PDY8_9ACAR|nr:beta-1:4-glucuronyltransferase 1-like protein [Dinothrombium tinctorium]RWS05402.1 beta-1:4-glucuronyltransferase 1-like protein [Dinothrombium tinctorium]RWS06476.1 beta-1:4-glucuronyltransferase 1-like protein [Dinothrombium tinctorium]RWS06480.1 beta-1:4-glucuronyltransferase 1-like protein [Dinothrombium tinctorium]
MAFYWKRVILILVLAIAILQIVHLTLLNKLELKKMERIKRSKVSIDSHSLPYATNDIIEDRKRMWNLVKESSILDSSGEYRIINHFLRANSLGARNHIRKDVTLVTHSSISRLHNLITVIERWQGLVSLSLFTLTEDIPLAIETLLLLRRCNSIIRYNVSFHLIYPLRIPLTVLSTTATITSRTLLDSFSHVDCENISKFVKYLQPKSMNYAHKSVPFPNNLLRNVGRRNALSDFVFVTDIDLIPSSKLREQFVEFASENKLFEDTLKEDKTVYVVPVYEMKEESFKLNLPKEKTELLRSIETMEARPFYFELCWKCHKYTDYEAWQREPQRAKLAALFEVLWQDPWEPFYISRNNVPLYDERFRQYGFNRISQVCELHIAGYKFSVLNNAFLIHNGLKTADSFHSEKDFELEKNRLLFRQFKSELKEKYPQSSRRCY